MRPLVLLLLLSSTAFPVAADRPDNLFQTAKGAYGDGLYTIAARNFRELIESYPDHPTTDDAAYLLATCYFHLKEYHETIETLADFSQTYPDSNNNSRVEYWIAASMFRLGLYEQALTHLGRQLGHYPVERELGLRALLLQGSSLIYLARYAEAVEPLRLAVAESQDAELVSEAIFKLAGCHLVLGNYSHALQLYGSLVLEYPNSEIAKDAVFFMGECYYFLGHEKEAEERYRRALSIYPEISYRATIYFRLARILSQGSTETVSDEQRTQLEEALTYIVLLEDRYPKRAATGEVRRLKADTLFDLRQYKQALGLYRKIAATETEDRQILFFNMGLAYLLTDDRERALAHFRLARKGAPTEIVEKCVYHEGMLLAELKRDQEAAQALQTYVNSFPNGVRAESVWRMLGLVHERIGAAGEARLAWSQVLNQFPTSVNRDEYLYRRASASLLLGDHQDALVDFNRLLTDTSESTYEAQSLYGIGYVYFERGEYARAMPYFVDAWQQGGAEVAVNSLYALGVCSYNLGDNAGAVEHFRRLTEGHPQSALSVDAYYNLGRLHYRSEAYSQALIEFARAFDLQGDTEDKGEALYWIGWCNFRMTRYVDSRDAFSALATEFPGHRRAPEAHYRAGLLEKELKNLAMAIVYFDNALRKLAPEAEGLRQETLYEKGWCLLEMQRREEALAVFDLLAREFPQSDLSAEAFYRVAELDFRATRYEQALAIFTRIDRDFRHSESHESGLYWAGMSALRLDRPEEALDHLFRYLIEYPGGVYQEAVLSAGRIALEVADSRKLVEKIYADIQGKAAIPADIQDLVRYEYALLIYPERRGEAFAILQSLRYADLPDAKQARVAFLVGKHYVLEGELERALGILRGVTETRSDRIGAEALVEVARTLEAQQEGEQASVEYLNVTYLYPQYADLVEESLYHSARLLKTLGFTERAQVVVSRLQEEFPGSHWLDERE